LSRSKGLSDLGLIQLKKNPAQNPAENPAQNPAQNPAHSTMKEGPFQYCLSHPDSIDQKGLWQLERILFLSTILAGFPAGSWAGFLFN